MAVDTTDVTPFSSLGANTSWPYGQSRDVYSSSATSFSRKLAHLFIVVWAQLIRYK